jgi:nucleoside-diphosphate-sugar epimerase
VRTLITGGTGLIGSRIAQRLLEQNIDVVLLDLHADLDLVRGLVEAYGAERVAAVTADIRDRSAVEQALQAHPVTAIIHLASILGSACQRQPRLTTEVNISGSAIIFDLAREHGIERVVCGSSISVFGADSEYSADELPLRDDAAQRVASGVRLYGASKVYLEALAGAYGDTGGPLIVGLRPSIVYGAAPRNASVDWLHSAVANAAEGREVVIANGDAELSLVHVEDVADQFVALLMAPASTLGDRRFFNTGGDYTSIRGFAETLQSECPDADIIVEDSVPGAVLGLAASIDGSAIDDVVGHQRTFFPLAAGVAKYVSDVRGS